MIKTHFFLFFVFLCLFLESLGDLKRRVVVDGVDDDDAVGDGKEVLWKFVRKTVRILRLDPFSVEKSDDVDGAAIRRDVGVVNVFDRRMERLKRRQNI